MKSLLTIPCYNCQEQIKRVIESIDQEVLEGIQEIIFINNLSQDNTSDSIKSYSNTNLSISALLIENKENYGLGGSFKIAHAYAEEKGFDNLIFFHGDDQAVIGDIKPMLSQMDSSNTAILGARFCPESKLNGYSKIREVGNVAINFIFSIFTRKTIFDIGSGVNIYKVSSLSELKVELWPNHIAFDVNILLGLVRNKLAFEFYPITWNEVDQVSNAGNFKTGFTVLFMLFKWFLRLENHSEKWKKNFLYDKINL